MQIYPELRRLEQEGLVTGRDANHGGTRRREVELTPSGRKALRAWLTAEDEPSVEWRDMALLKLFLADALTPKQALERVRALGERSARLVESFREESVPVAERGAARYGFEYAPLVARFYLEFNEWVVAWCEQVEREIAEGGKARLEAPPRPRRSAPGESPRGTARRASDSDAP